MSVETPNFTTRLEPQNATFAQPEAWSPPVTGFAERGQAEPPAPSHVGQNYGRSYDPAHAHYQTPGEVSPVAFPPVRETLDLKLSTEAAQNLHRLENSSKPEDAATFAALRGNLTASEQRDYERFQAAKASEIGMLLLHSLKLRDPNAFKEQFNGLSGQEKGKFDAFEAREDARIKMAVPEAAHLVGKLSADGERFIMPPAPAPRPQPSAPPQAMRSGSIVAGERYGATPDFHPVAPGTPRPLDEIHQPPTTRAGMRARFGRMIRSKFGRNR